MKIEKHICFAPNYTLVLSWEELKMLKNFTKLRNDQFYLILKAFIEKEAVFYKENN